MHPIILIAYLSMAVWLVPIFRQYGTKYFPFFLIFGIIDPFAYALQSIFHFNPLYLYPTTFTVVVLFMAEIKNKYLIIGSISFAAILTYLVMPNYNYVRIIDAFMDLVLLVIFCIHLVKIIDERKAINLFLVLMIAYTFLGVYKNISAFLMQDYVRFFVTTFIQIFLGIMFWFVTINTKEYKLSQTVIPN